MKIYLVEDEHSLRQLLVTYLLEAGYDVVSFSDGREAEKSINDQPDLWILDIMLPGLDGFSLIKSIKAINPNLPVIFMSARSEELDRVIGLEMGCDDYLPKPFLPRELVLRVKKLLSLVNRQISNQTIGQYVFDKACRVLRHDEVEIELSVKEFDLIDLFIKKQNQALSRNDILDAVWGDNYFGSERVVDDTLRRLRKKAPLMNLEAVYGYGYILKG